MWMKVLPKVSLHTLIMRRIVAYFTNWIVWVLFVLADFYFPDCISFYQLFYKMAPCLLINASQCSWFTHLQIFKCTQMATYKLNFILRHFVFVNLESLNSHKRSIMFSLCSRPLLIEIIVIESFGRSRYWYQYIKASVCKAGEKPTIAS